MSKRQRKTNEKRRRHRQARPARGRLAAGAGLAIGATLGAGAATADAATFTVTSTADTAGTCPTPSTCASLRQAINSANAAPNPDMDTNDVITFAAGVTGSIGLGGDLPDVTEGVDINGPGASTLSVDGNDNEIFYLNAGAATYSDVNISGLTITDGGGGVYSGGITNLVDTNTTVSNSVITGNTGALSGGGIYNGGQLILKYSQVSGNYGQYGGGIHNTNGQFAAAYSTISGNHATTGQGGGIRDYGSFSILIGSTVSGNYGIDGGGIFSVDSASNPVQVFAAYSTISGNHATSGHGGGVWAAGEGNAGFFASTVSGNTAVGNGGGLFLDLTPTDPLDPKYPSLIDTTVAGNSADNEGGGLFLANYDADLYNTLFGDNTAGDYPDLSGTVRADFSFVENISGANVTDYNVPGSNILGADPQLGALADNGGPTMTRALAPTSPALDKGQAFVDPDPMADPKYDQRLGPYLRTVDFPTIANNSAGGNGTDIGAFELQSLPPPEPPAAPPRCKGKTATVFRPHGRNLTGTNKRDVIVGTTAKDKINSRGGNDLVCAKGGKDTVNGGGGKDKLFGQGGKDTLKGKGGNDKLVGGAKKDKLVGGAGADKLLGKGGNDTCVGGPGKDTLKSC
jgi:hypothetical protein